MPNITTNHAITYTNHTCIHCKEILVGVGVKVMQSRADAPRSNPPRAILISFSLKTEET